MKLNTFFSSRLKRSSHTDMRTPGHQLIKPMREWFVCLALTVCSSVVLFGYIGYDFYTQYDGVDIPPQNQKAVSMYPHQDAEALIKSYDDKKALFDQLRTEQSASEVVPTPQIVNEATATNPVSVPSEEVPPLAQPLIQQ
jgi:hypothetical protein